ncbi:B12-binding domain-containing radical SAM protein [Thermodesulfobacteriota bacterium]
MNDTKIMFLMARPDFIPELTGLMATPPAGMLSIAGYLRQSFPDIQMTLRDFGAENIPLEDQLKAIAQYNPDVICLSARSFLYPATVKLADAIKERFSSIKVIFGGQHATLMKEDEQYPDVFDCVVFGEGEQAVAELIKKYIQGISWPQKYQTDFLKEISHDYAWDILESAKYYKRTYTPFYTDPIGSVVWSRGCPFNCFFCSNPAMWKGSKPRVRYRTPESVANELEFIEKHYHVKRVFVHDNTLNANVEKLQSICEEIIRRKIGIKWGAAGMRAESRLNPEILFPLLWKAGCRYISFGIESGDTEVLRNVGRTVSLREIEQALLFARKYGFKTSCGFTIGHIWVDKDNNIDGETEEQIKKTIRYIKYLLDKGLLWTYRTYVITPNRGSALYHAAIDHGLLSQKELDLLNRHYKSKPILEHPHLSRKTILKYHKEAYQLMVLNPKYVWGLLKGVRSIADFLGLARTGLFALKNYLLTN